MQRNNNKEKHFKFLIQYMFIPIESSNLEFKTINCSKSFSVQDVVEKVIRLFANVVEPLITVFVEMTSTFLSYEVTTDV